MEPELGAFGAVRTKGWQARVIRVVTDSEVNHAFVSIGDGKIIEAQPSGARAAFVGAYPDAVWSNLDLSDEQRMDIRDAALHHVGDRYSWWDVACIGLAQVFGVNLPRRVRARLADPHMNHCAQLIDVIYLDAGVHLYDDGRLSGDVSPGDIYRDFIMTHQRTCPI